MNNFLFPYFNSKVLSMISSKFTVFTSFILLCYSFTKIYAYSFSVDTIFRQGNATVLIGMAAVWAGVAATICATTIAGCWVSLAMIGAFQVATLAALGNRDGSVAETVPRSLTIEPLTETMQNITSDYSDHLVSAHPIIKNLTLLLGTIGDLSSGKNFDKRNNQNLNLNVTAALFDSHLGHHLAIALPHLTTEEFVDRLSNATPGEPDVSPKRRFFKRGYEVDWVSYNYDNVNQDLAQRFINTQGSDETDLWVYGASNFMSSHDGWKWCLDMNIDPNPGEPIDSNHLENIEVAVHGEIYTNTYGGIDGECNDYYDCVEGCD